MKPVRLCVALCLLLPGLSLAAPGFGGSDLASATSPIRLVTLDPGHFHAALFHKQMWAGVADVVHVYAPLGPDLLAHLERIARFNSRAEDPTQWRLEIHTGPESLGRLLCERPGEVVILSGRNRGKIDRINNLVQHGFHVLADKPWILETADLPKLRNALETAERTGVAAYDAMTQRFEITCLLRQELVNDRQVFGEPLAGTPSEPAVRMESVHYLYKEVAGIPARRPAWFFDIEQQGEGLTDVGTHLVDLVQWTLFPEQAIDCEREIQVLKGARWPTRLSASELRNITGDSATPASSLGSDGVLEYYANNSVLYTIRGVHTLLQIRWEYAAPPGVRDSETAIFQGTRSRVEVRQGAEENFRPEVYVVPNEPAESASIGDRLKGFIERMQGRWPGLSCEKQSGRFRLVIPDRLRIGHEEHFELLTRTFLEYVRFPQRIPKWERPNMVAKYYVTTQGVELARNSPGRSRPQPKEDQ